MAYAAVVERTVPISRQRFFAELMDFGGIAKISPDAVESVTCAGEGVGAVRTVHIKGLPGPVIERLDVAFDGRVFAYSIINESALPFEHYVAVVELADAPNDGCHVRWSSNWTAGKGSTEDICRQVCTGLYQQMIDGIVRVAGA